MTPFRKKRASTSSAKTSRTREKASSAKKTPPKRAANVYEVSDALKRFLASQDGVIVADTKLRVLVANIEARRMWNYREGALSGISLLRLFTERSRGQIEHAVARGLKKLSFAGEGMRRDGSLFSVEARGEIVKADGWSALVLRVRDVSTHKITETALRDNAALLGLMASQVPAVLWATDRSLRFTSSLGAALNRVSSYPNRVVGQTLPDILGADDPNHPVLAAHHQALKGKSASYDYDWMDRTFRCRVEPLFDAAGLVAGVVGIGLDVTDARRAEKDLGESERRFRTLFAHNPHPMWVYDLDTLAFLEVNEAAVSRYGYSREEFSKMKVTDIRPEEDVPQFLESLRKRREEVRHAGVWRHRTKSGAVIDVDITSHALVFDGKRAALVVAQDVTERKRAEEEMKRFEEMFRGFFEHSAIGMYRTTPDGKVLMANPAFARMLGFSSPGELMRGDFNALSVQAAYDRSVFLRAMEQDGWVSGMEYSWRRPDGTLIYARESARAVRDERGAIAYFEGTVEEITERKRAEDALRESQRAMATLISNLPGIAYRCQNAPEWPMEFISEGCRDITGYAPEDFLQKGTINYSDIIHPDDREKVWGDVQAALKAGRPFQLLYRIRTATEAEKWVWEQGQGVWDKDGNLVALEGFISDVTARKKIEDETRRREADLRRHQAALVELGRHAVAAKDDPAAMLRRLTETAARTLDVERVSVWLYTADHSAIECLDLYEQGPARHSGDVTLHTGNYPAYFSAIEESRVIAAHDALNDPRTKEFSKAYLKPFGITSMLDAPFRLGGKVAGIVCHEHVGEPRQWTPEEQNFAGSIADLAALLLEGQERAKLLAAFETSEGRYRTLVENAPFCVHTADLDGRLTSINAAGVAMLEAADERELLGRSKFEFVDEIERKHVEALFERAKRGETVSYEFTLHLPEGSKRLTANMVPLRDAAGNVVQIMGVAQDITERVSLETMLKASYEQVLHWSQHDSLTGLLNQSHLQKAINEEIRRAQEKNAPFAFLFVDLDRFKRINEMYGHLAGDRYLRHVSGVIQAVAGDKNIAARVGGDQFGILLPGADESAAAQFCAALLNKIRRTPLALPQEHLRLTASVGIAVFPSHGQTAAEILAQSERAMEEVKIGSLDKGQGGMAGDGYKVAGGSAPSRVSPALLHKDRLVTEALREGRLVAAYQAIRHLPSGRDTLWEALVRIAASDGSVLEPSEFLFDSLRHGQSSTIDLAVVSHGLDTLSRLRSEGKHDHVAFTFNISPTSLQDPEFFGAVAAKMHACGVSPKQIVFEFSENALLADIHPVLPVIESLHRSGIRFAIDDFGAGATSLRHLVALPLSFIKIDGTYIRALPSDARARVLVEGIVRMARKLGVEVIAEWVENEECLHAVRDLGIEYVQGFFLSQPRLDPWAPSAGREKPSPAVGVVH